MDGQLTVYKQYFEEDFLKRTEECVTAACLQPRLAFLKIHVT
jgi:hypothetical protein